MGVQSTLLNESVICKNWFQNFLLHLSLIFSHKYVEFQVTSVTCCKFTLFTLIILSPIVHISIMHLLCFTFTPSCFTPSIVTLITIAANSICQTPLMSPLLKMCHNCFYLVYVFFFKWLLISRMTSLPLTFINAEVFGVNENGFGVNDLSAPIAFCS